MISYYFTYYFVFNPIILPVISVICLLFPYYTKILFSLFSVILISWSVQRLFGRGLRLQILSSHAEIWRTSIWLAKARFGTSRKGLIPDTTVPLDRFRHYYSHYIFYYCHYLHFLHCNGHYLNILTTIQCKLMPCNTTSWKEQKKGTPWGKNSVHIMLMSWPNGHGVGLAIVWSPVRTLPPRVYGGALVVWPGMPFPIRW